MNNRKKTSLAQRVVSLASRARTLYQKKDEAFQQLLEGCAAGEVIETKRGRFEIVDNFAARNVGYRPASFHRYELKEVKTKNAAAAAVKPDAAAAVKPDAAAAVKPDAATAVKPEAVRPRGADAVRPRGAVANVREAAAGA